MKYKLKMQPDDVLKAIEESIHMVKNILMILNGHVKMALGQILSFFIMF